MKFFLWQSLFPPFWFNFKGLWNPVFLETTGCVGKVRAHSGRLHPLERFCSFGPERSHEEWSGSEWGDSKGLGENVDRGVEGWGGVKGDAQGLAFSSSTFSLYFHSQRPPIIGLCTLCCWDSTFPLPYLLLPLLISLLVDFNSNTAAHWPLSGLPDGVYVPLCNPRALCTLRTLNPVCSNTFAFVIICAPT